MNSGTRIAEPGQPELYATVLESLEEEAVERGVPHRAEPLLTQALLLDDTGASLRSWFCGLPDGETQASVLQCLGRLAEIQRELSLDLPILDLSGLAPGAARSILEDLAPSKTPR